MLRGADAVAEPVRGLSASIAPEVNAFRVANGLPGLAPNGRLARGPIRLTCKGKPTLATRAKTDRVLGIA